MAVSPETRTALPVLLAKIPGFCSSARRFKIWMPLVTPMPITEREGHDVGRVKRDAGTPMNPSSQVVPMATGSKARTTEASERKCRKIMMTMAASAYHAAC